MKLVCSVCGRAEPQYEFIPGNRLDSSIIPFLRSRAPQWNPEGLICRSCLNKARGDFVEASLTEEKGALSEMELEVIQSIKDHEVVAESPLETTGSKITFGDRMADRIAEFGGSWSFIILFLIGMAVWTTLNSHFFNESPVDPYPFILLNLVLSCVAALQAPVIMMSQNRQERKDRRRAEADYKTNLKAELEIRYLHIKMDQLLDQHWHRLLEIQKVQTDLLQDLSQHLVKKQSSPKGS